MGVDERESQLSAMFDGELPDSECELLARRLSRDAALKRQWAGYALIGAVLRDEPLRARRDAGGRLAAGIAARLAVAIDAEQGQAGEGQSASAAPLAAGAGAAQRRWARPAAGFAIAAGVAALSVFWLQGRSPEVADGLMSAAVVTPAEGAAAARGTDAGADRNGVDEVTAPPAATRGAAAEVVVAGNGYPAPAGRGIGSGEPESYVVPMPAGRNGAAPPAQLANYVVAHSEFSAPLSRRSLLSALVASEAAAADTGASGMPSPVAEDVAGAATPGTGK